MRLLAIVANLLFVIAMLLIFITERPHGMMNWIVTGLAVMPSIISLIYILWWAESDKRRVDPGLL